MGLKNFYTQSYPPAPTFDVSKDIPDLSGKVIIVTGGNTGIGKETIKVLLNKNAKVYMASRSRQKAEEAIAELQTETGRSAIFLELDLADLSKVAKAAKEFLSKEPALHVLFNSGGVMVPPLKDLTANGWDLQFGTNVLGHASFTLHLVPALLAGAKLSPDGKARVVGTSSLVAYRNTAPWIRWDTLQDGPKRDSFGTRHLYEQSKYGVIAFHNEFARRYGNQGINSNSVNPGNLDTDLQRHLPGPAQVFVKVVFSHPAPFGALTQLYAGVSPDTVNDNGGWFIPWARRWEHSKETSQPDVEAKLWDWVQEQHKPYAFS